MTLQNGIASLYDGTKKLTSNNEKLLSGSQELSDGAGKLSDGADKLYNGSLELGDGLEELYDGCDTLNVSIADGAEEIKSTNLNEVNAQMFSAPVESKETILTDAKNNGQAMSAYMRSVGLWGGCMAYCLLFEPDEEMEKKKINKKNAVSFWAKQMAKCLIISVVQAIVMIGVLHFALGFDPISMSKTLLVATVASMSFMMMFYFFNLMAGKIGSFLLLVFMVLQLSGAAGTYPLELSDSFYQKIHPYMPFTYTVNAFRSTTANGLSIAPAIGVLAAIFVVFIALNFVSVYFKAGKQEDEDENVHVDMNKEVTA